MRPALWALSPTAVMERLAWFSLILLASRLEDGIFDLFKKTKIKLLWAELGVVSFL